MKGWTRQKYVTFSPGWKPACAVTGTDHWIVWAVGPMYGAPYPSSAESSSTRRPLLVRPFGTGNDALVGPRHGNAQLVTVW